MRVLPEMQPILNALMATGRLTDDHPLGLRYGKPRSSAKLPRKLKKAYAKLSDRVVEFPDDVLSAVTLES